MKQNTVNFKRQGFLAKGSINSTSNIFNCYAFNLKRKLKPKIQKDLLLPWIITDVDLSLCNLLRLSLQKELRYSKIILSA